MPSGKAVRIAAAMATIGIAAPAGIPLALAAVDETDFAGETLTIHATVSGSASDIHQVVGLPRNQSAKWAMAMGMPIWRHQLSSRVVPNGGSDHA